MPRIEERDYSWTEQANILFIDRYGYDNDEIPTHHSHKVGIWNFDPKISSGSKVHENPVNFPNTHHRQYVSLIY